MSTHSPVTPRRRAAHALAALTVAALGASVVEADVSAAAGKANVKTTISLTKKQDKLTGKVTSRKKACRSGRVVTLKWQAPGVKSFREIRTDATNRRGVWVVPAPERKIPAGKYFSTTKASPSCQASRSKTITVR